MNKLIELGKPLDSMTYPDRTHSISEGPGMTVHLYHLRAVPDRASSVRSAVS